MQELNELLVSGSTSGCTHCRSNLENGHCTFLFLTIWCVPKFIRKKLS